MNDPIFNLSQEDKETIDGMSQFQMAKLWRFGETGTMLLQGVTGKYFRKVFYEEKGGFTPEISKQLGWDK